ncbi:pheromone receptor transcription factor, partial [Tremellales sp. Uapishka_1]
MSSPIDTHFTPRLPPSITISTSTPSPLIHAEPAFDYTMEGMDFTTGDHEHGHEENGVGVMEGVDMDLVADFSDFQETKEDLLDDTHQLTPALSHQSMPPSATTTANQNNNADNGMFSLHMESGLSGGDDDDDDEDDAPPVTKRTKPNHPDVPGGFTLVDKDGDSGRRKIRIEYITDKSRRHITFSKRKAGIMKKAYELSTLTGTQVLLLVVSETGLVYTFTTAKLQPLVTQAEGKNLIQACLNAPDGLLPDGTPAGGPVAATRGKNGGLSIRPHKLTAQATAAMAASAQAQSAAAMHDDHSNAQSNSQSAIGQGTPGGSRPKKRMPSSRKKSQAGGPSDNQQPPPPVPPLPDLNRQASPNSHLMQSQQSPLSAGFHVPQEYAQNQPYGYPQGGNPQDYGQYYGQGHPHAQQYLNLQQQQQQHAHLQYQREQQEHARLMMERNRGNMGMQGM